MISSIQEFAELNRAFSTKLEQDWSQLQEDIAIANKPLYTALTQKPLLPEDQKQLLTQPNMLIYLMEQKANPSISPLIQYLTEEDTTLYCLQLDYIHRFILDMQNCTIQESYLQEDLFSNLQQVNQFCKRELERALALSNNIVDLIGQRYIARYYPSLTIMDIAHNAFSRD